MDIQQWISHFTHAARTILPSTSHVEWTTSLADTNHVKRDIKGLGLRAAEVDRLTQRPQPRFIWRARMEVNGQRLAEVFFDATGMRRSQVAFEMIWFSRPFRVLVGKVLDVPAVQHRLPPQMLQFLQEHTG